MTDAEKITILKSRDNENETDQSLSAALLTAKYAIMSRAYPFEKDFTDIPFPGRYDILQIDIANVLIKKMGADGETSHIENGIERTYESADIPQSMLMPVVPKVGVIK